MAAARGHRHRQRTQPLPRRTGPTHRLSPRLRARRMTRWRTRLRRREMWDMMTSDSEKYIATLRKRKGKDHSSISKSMSPSPSGSPPSPSRSKALLVKAMAVKQTILFSRLLKKK